MALPPVIHHSNQIFPYKPSILGYHHLWKPPIHSETFVNPGRFDLQIKKLGCITTATDEERKQLEKFWAPTQYLACVVQVQVGFFQKGTLAEFAWGIIWKNCTQRIVLFDKVLFQPKFGFPCSGFVKNAMHFNCNWEEQNNNLESKPMFCTLCCVSS